MSLPCAKIGHEAVGLCRLGWISELLFTPVITGVLAGIAVEIVVRQIPVILGVSGGGTTTVDRIRQVTDQISHINGWLVGIAIGVLAIIAAAQRISHRLPGTLAALILSIVAVDTLGLASRHGVAILGAVHGGLPHVRLPSVSWSQLRRMPGLVLTVAFVCVAQTAATVRSSATGAEEAGNVNRDLIGVGTGSVAAGLIGVFPVDASPPNTAIATASGTRSQLANAMAAVVVLAVVLAATASLANCRRRCWQPPGNHVATAQDLFRPRVVLCLAGTVGRVTVGPADPSPSPAGIVVQPRLVQLVRLLLMPGLEIRAGQRPAEFPGGQRVFSGEPPEPLRGHFEPRRSQLRVMFSAILQRHFEVLAPVEQGLRHRETVVEIPDRPGTDGITHPQHVRPGTKPYPAAGDEVVALVGVVALLDLVVQEFQAFLFWPPAPPEFGQADPRPVGVPIVQPEPLVDHFLGGQRSVA